MVLLLSIRNTPRSRCGRPLSLSLTLFLGLGALGCPHELSRSAELRAAERESEADEHLANARLNDARASYDASHVLDPGRRRAALGSALTRLLLIPDSKPVAELLTLCGQPLFDVEKNLFGPHGYLANRQRGLAGEAHLTVLERPSPAQLPNEYRESAFQPERFRVSRARGYLLFSMDDPGMGESGEPGALSFSVNTVDVYDDDDVRTPLIDGMSLDVKRLGVYALLGRTYYASRVLGQGRGRILIRGSTQPGDRLEIEFDGAELDTCSGSCDAGPSAQLRLEGLVKDVVDVEGPAWAVPFQGIVEPGEVTPATGPWFSYEARILDQCGQRLTWELVAEELVALATRLEEVARLLAVGLGDDPTDVAFDVPRAVFQGQQDLPLNGVDLSLVRSGSLLVAATLRLAAAYRIVDGPVARLVKSYEEWTWGEGGPLKRLVRGLEPRGLYEALSVTLLARAAGFDLSLARVDLQAALDEAVRGLSTLPEHGGFLDLSNAQARPFVLELTEQLTRVRQSLTSAAPVPLARNPLYALHLRRFFEEPLDRDRLLARSGKPSLLRWVPGDPDAASPYARNPRILLEIPSSPDELQRWLGDWVSFPESRRARA